VTDHGTSQDRPLLHARRPVGRPRKPQPESDTDTGNSTQRAPVRCLTVAAVPPRLLDLEATAAYLGLSPWTVRSLEGQGILRRVRVPVSTGELRKLLFDREDLDHLVTLWKDQAML
jgi:hypothetical protein